MCSCEVKRVYEVYVLEIRMKIRKIAEKCSQLQKLDIYFSCCK